MGCEKLEWVPLVPMPCCLARGDPMPPADAASNEKETNDGQSRARAPHVIWLDTEGRSESLDEVLALGMGLKF